MSEWLDEVESAGGEKCGNCGTWRVLHDYYYIEDCPNCGDPGYDIYGVEDIGNLIP